VAAVDDYKDVVGYRLESVYRVRCHPPSVAHHIPTTRGRPFGEAPLGESEGEKGGLFPRWPQGVLRVFGSPNLFQRTW
jgi:hypothetical protein